MEKIYTIPVNTAFEECMAASDVHTAQCPFCKIANTLEDNELELILGASMMEPDVRIKTNELGFCPTHYDMLFHRRNRLGLALMLESHLMEVRKDADKQSFAEKTAPKLGGSCYVCGRIEGKLSKMLETAVLLWECDPDFVKKLRAQHMICLPHYQRVVSLGREKLNKKKFPDFKADVDSVFLTYFDSVQSDVSWFCKKFDYRYEEEPWGDAKDAVERAIRFLSGDLHQPPANKKDGAR